jgi:carboxypeptidase Q
MSSQTRPPVALVQMMRCFAALAGLACSLLGQTLSGQAHDEPLLGRLRAEANTRSEVMRVIHVLTDRFGPRLTGSPQYAESAHWAAAELARWGLRNVHKEPFDLGREGWTNEIAYGYLTEPVRQNLTFVPYAFTGSTNGVVSAPIVSIVLPTAPTREEMTQWITETAPRLKGSFVMRGVPADIPVDFSASTAKRLDVEQLRRRYNQQAVGTGNNPARQPSAGEPARLSAVEVGRMAGEMLKTSGALMLIRDSARSHGMVTAGADLANSSNSRPTIYLRNEDYGRIHRLLKDGEHVTAEFRIQNRPFPAGRMVDNVIAEIPGGGGPGVVMIGAHLDSWHGATGATDNAAGVAIAMEAMRLLHSLGKKPRRTIRLALWGGEEFGLMGSADYVSRHFGSYEKHGPEFDELDCYINVDIGTGQIRGANVFGPGEAAAILKEAVADLADGGAGVVEVAATRTRTRGGSDSGSFRIAGLPTIGWDADPIEYQSHTWHTNLDTFERIVPGDVRNNALVLATVAWRLAEREEPMPRFSRPDMPPLPAAGSPNAGR